MTYNEAKDRVCGLRDRLREKAADLNAREGSEKYDDPNHRAALESERDAEAVNMILGYYLRNEG